MALEIGEVSSRRDLKTFIYLPEKIHQGHLNWVPPLYVDEWKYFDRSKNKSFAYCPATLLLAWRDGRPVGRAMGIINSRFNEFRNVKLARFGYLETPKDPEIVHALLARVEEWARGQGMTRIIGPYGFSDQDPEGFLIEGFENRATIATYYNFEWLPGLVESEGYVKDIDYFVYKVEVPPELPDFYRKIYERGMRRGGFDVLEFRKRREIKPWIRPILRLMNECYTAGNIYGFAPLDDKEMDDLAKRYLPYSRPQVHQGRGQGPRGPGLHYRHSRHDGGNPESQGPSLPVRLHPDPPCGQDDPAARPAAGRGEGRIPRAWN